MCTNLLPPNLASQEAVAEEVGRANVGLLPARAPNEHMIPPEDGRIMCHATMTGRNRMAVGACGPEQTKITYSFAQILAQYEGLNINSVSTNRSEGAAGSFFILSDIYGDPARLQAFASKITQKPWFQPGGRKVIPDSVVHLKIFAPDRLVLLRDVLGVVSVEYGINIESMVHRTFENMCDDSFDLQRTTEGRYNAVGIAIGPANAEEATGHGSHQDKGKGGYTGLVSVTHMRLEIPSGVDINRLKRELKKLGKEWEFRWEERTCGSSYDTKMMRTVFGSFN